MNLEVTAYYITAQKKTMFHEKEVFRGICLEIAPYLVLAGLFEGLRKFFPGKQMQAGSAGLDLFLLEFIRQRI